MSLITTKYDIDPKECSKYTSCDAINFDNVASKDGKSGYISRLLNTADFYLQKAVKGGYLTEGAAGNVMGQAIQSAFSSAIQFELSRAKDQKAIAVEHANFDKILMQIKMLEEEQNLKEQQTSSQIENEHRKIIVAEVSAEHDNKLKDAQISKINCECDIAAQKLDDEFKTADANRILIGAQTEKANQEIATINTNRSLDAEIKMQQADEIKCKCDLQKAKNESDISLIEKNKKLIDSQREKTDSESLTINEMRAHDSRLKEKQANKIDCECEIAHEKTSAEVALSSSQRELVSAQKNEIMAKTNTINAKRDKEVAHIQAEIDKLECSCANQTSNTKAQNILAKRQAMGFDDHIALEYYKTKLNVWGMIFSDAGLSDPTDSIGTSEINKAAKEVSKRLNGCFDASTGEYTREGGSSCS